jgi:acyl carrier protein
MQTDANCIISNKIVKLVQQYAFKETRQQPVVLSEVFEKLQKILSEQLDVDISEVKPEANLQNDLGADSLDAVELIMAIEEEFDMEIPDEDAECIVTVQSALDYIIIKNINATNSGKEFYQKILIALAEKSKIIVERMATIFEKFKITPEESEHKLIQKIISTILEPKRKIEKFSSLFRDLNIQQFDKAERLIHQAMDTNQGIKMMKIANLLERLNSSELDEAVESIRKTLDCTDGAQIIKISNLLEELSISTLDEAVSLAFSTLDTTERSKITEITILLEEFGIKDIEMATQLADCALERVEVRKQLAQNITQKETEIAQIQSQIETYQTAVKDKTAELSKLRYQFSNLVLHLPT